MTTQNRTYKILIIMLSAIFISSNAISLSSFTNNSVNASFTPIVNSIDDYGDLLQYEWPQIHGDPGFTRFSSGPAPESPDILWKTTVKNIQSYVTAFNGKVLVTTSTNIIALEKDTGAVIWNTTLPNTQRWPAIFKIDETHLVIANYCLEIKTGKILWTSNEFNAKVSYWAESVYSPENKMFYVQGDSVVQAWNFSNPSESPRIEWETYVSGSITSGTGIQYGEGRVFPGSFEPHQVALNASTGVVLWDTETTGAMSFSGSYYEGKLLKAGEQDNVFYCFDAETGEILWKYNPGTQLGYWVSGSAAAYDMVYELNKDGNLYALDSNSGQIVWKYEGPGYLFWPGWPVIADGKIYATTGQRVSYDPYTLEYSKSEFVCLDALTGDLVWKLPIETHSPRDSIAIAYGNLYVIPGFINEMTMDEYTTFDEVWAIGTESWPLWRNNSQNNGAGNAGPKELNLRWKSTTNGGVVSTPIAANGRIFVGSQDKNIYSLDATDGRKIWNFTTGARIKSSLAFFEDKVYLGPDDGYIYCLDALNGSLLWKTQAGGYIEAQFKAVTGIRSSPIVFDNKVYVGSLDTNLYCLDANSGNIEWKFETQGYITSTPAVSEGNVYVTSQEPSSGALYKIDSNNGSLIWKREIEYEIVADRGTDLHVSPTVADGLVFVATNKDYYYGINATSGEIEWKYLTSRGSEGIGGYLVGSMAYNNQHLYIVDMFFITALNASNGEVIWKSWLGTELYTTPAYADGKIYVTTDRRFIYAINATDGTRLSFFETNSNSWSSPSVYEARVYFGSNDNNIYCLSDYPIKRGQISVELDKNKVENGEAVIGFGQLEQVISYATVNIFFKKSDETINSLQVTSQKNGAFSFNFLPDKIGNWTISIFCSGSAYILEDKELSLKVIEKQQDNDLPEQPQNGNNEPTDITHSEISIEYIILCLTLIYVGAVIIVYRKTKKSRSDG
ncbi:MAG: PQQ-binding-like beta-propeller repeat protein [Candidatus Bathyarchaeota archaeon]